MPRRRRVAKARDGGRLVPGQSDKWEQLRVGFEFHDGSGFPREGPAREPAIRAAWEANSEALIIACREREGPGHRPWGWWEYNAPRTLREHFGHGARHLNEETEGDFLPPPYRRHRPLRREYVQLMARFGLLTPVERTALGA